MNKRGLIGWIILGVVVVLLLGAVSTGIYFYNFHVFKTLRVCVGEGHDVVYPCGVVQDCIDAANSTGVIDLSQFNFNGMPDFLREKLEETLDNVVYCNESCFVREVRGIDLENQDFEMLDECEEGEIEITLDIHGKEGVEILKYLKSLKDNN